MSFVIPPFVSERETGHYWPNKQYDDPADEDCVFCAGLMQYLAHAPGAAPATLFEAERIRQDAGLGPTGPASSGNLIAGEQKRYGWSPALVPAGFTALWAALTPGMSATASGKPIDCPTDSPFRRFLRNYTGGHRVFVGRYDNTDRVWLMDPEGPKDGSYQGQWATKAQLAQFVKNGSSHTIAQIAEDSEVIVVTDTVQKNVTVESGAVMYDPATGAKTGTTRSKIVRFSPYGVTIGGTDARVMPIGNPFALTAFKTNDPAVSVAPVPDVSEQQLAAARDLGFQQAKDKAEAAVASITP